MEGGGGVGVVLVLVGRLYSASLQEEDGEVKLNTRGQGGGAKWSGPIICFVFVSFLQRFMSCCVF